MSGHSKWANIKHKKAKSDEKRGREFTKVAKEIAIAVRMGGGPDPDSNSRLKLAIQKAKAINMPNDNINRSIKKGSGELGGEAMEEFFYEGYAPGGVAIMLKIATDNRNRTSADIRHLFSKYGGNMGENGCVSWMFEHVGLITLNKESVTLDADEFMLSMVECGADDVRENDENYEVITPMDQLMQVVEQVEKIAPIEEADLAMIPKNMMEVTDKDLAEKVLKLIDVLEDHDDVENVYSNLSIADELIEQLS